MNRLELYGIALVVLVITILGAYAKGHHAGYLAAVSKAETQLAAANAKIDQLQDQKADAARESAEKYEEERTRHENELAAARATVSDRLCRSPNPAKVPEGGTATASAPAGPAGPAVPQRATIDDDWRYAFVAACQHDSDALRGWQSWWASQQ